MNLKLRPDAGIDSRSIELSMNLTLPGSWFLFWCILTYVQFLVHIL